MLKQIALAAVLAIAAMPATAQTTAPADGKKLDPNRKICEQTETTGSRLRAHKVCMTAAQWEEKRARDREEIERAQQNTGVPKSG